MDIETQEALNFIANDVGFGRHAFGHFMEAMKVGYAGTPVKGAIAELPGSKTIEYRHDKWHVLDTYFVTPQSDYSGGSIVMWYGPVPVWMMQYVGRYDKQAIPCLKAALKENYLAGTFRGGRGPQWFTHEGYTYCNFVDAGSTFSLCSGKESIFSPAGKPLGWHQYQAMYMVDRTKC